MPSTNLIKGAVAAIAAFTVTFVVLPIWLYLVHWMLKACGAGDLQFFLFWVYVVTSLFSSATITITKRV